MDDDALADLEVEDHMSSAILLLNADRTRHAARLQEMEKAVELGMIEFLLNNTRLLRFWLRMKRD